MPLRRKALAVVALPIFGLSVATVAFLRAVGQDRRARQSVEHSEAVTAQTRLLVALAVDAERGARGFVLTGQQPYLDPYNAARAALPGAVDRLQSLLGAGAEAGKVADMRSLIDRRLEISEGLLGAAPYATAGTRLNMLLEAGRNTTDAIRQQASELEAVQRRALARARIDADRAEDAGRAAVGCLAVGFIGGLAGILVFTRGVSDRIAALLQSAAALSEGRPVPERPVGSDEDEIGELGSALHQASELLRRREQALDEARAFQARLLDSAPTVMLRVRLPNLGCLYVSKNVERVFGLPATVEADFLRDRLRPGDRAMLEAAAERLTADGEPARSDVLFQMGGGEERWVTVVMVREVDEPQDHPTALVYLRDEDERYRAQQELKEREATLSAVLDASPDVITITDAVGTVTLVNPALERVLGWTPTSLLRCSPWELLDPADRDRARAKFDALVGGTRSHAVLTCRARHADGRLLMVEAHASALRDAQGHPVGTVTVTRDISERVRVEERERAARQAAERANRAKSEFVSRMSHELRTPLNAVIGFAQLLELDHLTPEQQESVGYILKGGRHLLDLIDDILDIARIETGRLKLSAEPVALGGVFTDVADMVNSLAVVSNVELIEPEVADGVHVLADRQRLIQVLLNLCSNAIKYNRPGGTVRLAYQLVDGDRLRIDVVDTGPGIRLEDLPLLFEPFERLGAEQTGIEGTGIGLSLSRQLAEAMGGTIEVDTVLGKGSTFSLVLSRAEGPMERYDRTNGHLVRAPASVTEGTVLHIEDNLSNLKLVERILARHAAVRVIATMQGRLGIELAREHQPRVVLLDLHLPDMGGDEVLRQLREDPATRDIPVVIASADATRGEIQRLLAAGAAAYITKPIDLPELLRTIDDVRGGTDG